MGLELETDRYPPITSQTQYPLRHGEVHGVNWLNTITVKVPLLRPLVKTY